MQPKLVRRCSFCESLQQATLVKYSTCFHGQLIINFTEVAIKIEKEEEKKEEWITCKTLPCHLLSLKGGKKEMAFPLDSVQTNKKKGHNDQDIVIFTEGIFQTIYITVDFFFLIQPPNGNTFKFMVYAHDSINLC